MLLGFLVVVVFLGLFLDAAYRLLAFALLWFAPILAALAAMQIALELRPDDPGQVFWAFTLAAIGVRFLIGCLAYAAGARA